MARLREKRIGCAIEHIKEAVDALQGILSDGNIKPSDELKPNNRVNLLPIVKLFSTTDKTL